MINLITKNCSFKYNSNSSIIYLQGDGGFRMKFEKLTDSKIKVIFTAKDLILNNISTKEFFADSSISQKLLEYLLLKAENELDFKTEDCKLLVEAVKYSGGGLAFTITKLADYNKATPISLIYKFENFADFLDLCTHIKNTTIINLENFSEQFSLYLYNNTYYLFINDYLNIPLGIINVFDEFGEHIYYPYKLEGIINEYGKIIYEKNVIVEGIKII